MERKPRKFCYATDPTHIEWHCQGKVIDSLNLSGLPEVTIRKLAVEGAHALYLSGSSVEDIASGRVPLRAPPMRKALAPPNDLLVRAIATIQFAKLINTSDHSADVLWDQAQAMSMDLSNADLAVWKKDPAVKVLMRMEAMNEPSGALATNSGP